MTNATFFQRVFATPVNELTEEEAKAQIHEISSRLSAGWGYADEQIVPASKLFNDAQDRRTALREHVGDMFWQMSYEKANRRAGGMPFEAYANIVLKAFRAGKKVSEKILDHVTGLGYN